MRRVHLDRTDSYIRALVYGDSGSGKTTFIGTFTDIGPLLVLNARGQPVTFRGLAHPPLVLDIEQMTDFNKPYTYLASGQPWDYVEKGHEKDAFYGAVWDYFGPDGGKFVTMAVDSLTQVQRIALNEIVGDRGLLPGDTPKSRERQHWGKALQQLTFMVDKYYTLPMHVVMTALTRRDMIESMGVAMHNPFLWGQTSLEAPSYAEIVGRLIIIEGLAAHEAQAVRKRTPKLLKDAYNILLTRGGRTFVAKWQGVTNPPSYLLNPSAAKVLEVIEGQVGD